MNELELYEISIEDNVLSINGKELNEGDWVLIQYGPNNNIALGKFTREGDRRIPRFVETSLYQSQGPPMFKEVVGLNELDPDKPRDVYTTEILPVPDPIYLIPGKKYEGRFKP